MTTDELYNKDAIVIMQILSRFRDEIWQEMGPIIMEGSGENICISIKHSNVTIQPEMVTLIRLSDDLKTSPGWSVSKWQTIYNYPDAPDDIEETFHESDLSPIRIVAKALQIIANENIVRFFDKLSDEHYAEICYEQVHYSTSGEGSSSSRCIS